MNKDGYVLRTAEYSADAQGAGVRYTFRNQSGASGDMFATVTAKPSLIKPDSYENWKRNEQGKFKLIQLGIPGIKDSEILYSNIGGGSMMAFVDRGTMRISELPHTLAGPKGLKVVSKTTPEQTLNRFKRIAAILGPEISEAARTMSWNTLNVQAAYPK